METPVNLIVGLIFTAFSIICGYIAGWNAGREQTIDNMFNSGKIDATTYKKLKGL